LTLDTTTATQTTLVTGSDLQSMPLNGRDFTQLISVAPGFGGYSAGGFGSLNGTRANQVNWQIDGVDNNDLWHNVPAVNQGGVLGIAGIVLPIDSIDQFSVQTQAAPESGRNPGGTVDLALRSGGNSFHGSAYEYIRNEAFAAAAPFSDTKKENRNNQYGFSFGGPLLKDRLFFFTTFEKQRFVIGQPGRGTEPSTAYQAAALQKLANFGVAENPVSANLMANLWPSYALNGAAVPDNYSSPDPEYGYSYNGLAKLDFKNQRQEYALISLLHRSGKSGCSSRIANKRLLRGCADTRFQLCSGLELDSNLHGCRPVACRRKLFPANLQRLQFEFRSSQLRPQSVRRIQFSRRSKRCNYGFRSYWADSAGRS